MDAQYVIDQVNKAGSTIQVDGERLAVGQPGCIDDDLRELISTNRDDVYDYLKAAIDELTQLAVNKAWTLYEQRVAESEVTRVMGDTTGIANYSPTTLDGWACALTLRTMQARQIIPKGWNKIADCKRCGKVWSEHDLPTLSCGWCWMRVKGLPYPQPDK